MLVPCFRFLKSIREKQLLEYNASERRWVWDEDRISAMDVTGNVLHLLSSKMSGLMESTQSALKVAACFGVVFKSSVLEHLSTKAEYSDLQCGLEHAVVEGFMIRVGVSNFKFVHDKVREAAYSLIPSSEKNQYHYSLGMALWTTTKGNNVDDIVFSMADQINHCNDSSNKCSDSVLLVSVNEMAGVKAVNCHDFVAARAYLNIALSFLPADHWNSRYDQSLHLFFILAESAYACGDMEKAQALLHEILQASSCIEDKLQAYYLLVTILIACGKGVVAYTTCHDVLTQLGEKIPQLLECEQKNRMIEDTSKAIQHINVLQMKKMDEKRSISLKFYCLMATVAFFTKPNMLIFCACRTIALTIQHGLSKYSLMGLCQYAAVKASSTTAKDIEEASRLGKATMACLKKRFHSAEVVAQVPVVYFTYYGLVAFHTEPLQNCADMLQKGFDAGLSVGDSATAFLNSVQHIKTSLIAGEKLSTLLEKVDYYLELTDLYKNELMKTYLLIFHDTISSLISQSKSEGSKTNSISSQHGASSLHFHCGLRAFWLGHSERCQHFLVKVLQSSSVTAKLSNIVAVFIQGLNSFQLLKTQNTAKLRAIAKNAINVLKAAHSHSRWNFRNKVHLLEAESFSHRGKDEEAKASYAASIVSARSSRFIHECGLACELAGFHYKKVGDHRSAWGYFNQAKQCYADWGSQIKVDSVTRQLKSFQVASTEIQDAK